MNEKESFASAPPLNEEALPTYQQATEPPPSYQSLFGEIKDARKQSNNVFEFLVKFFVLLGNTIGVAIILGILLAIPITMIVLGAKYKDECPCEDKIPIYLIVMGSFLIFRNLSNMCSRVGSSNDENEESRSHKCLDSLVDLFLFCWFIAGNYWVYHVYKPSYTQGQPDYCQKTLYLFAFWLMNVTYILMGFFCCCTCFIGICVAAVADNDDE